MRVPWGRKPHKRRRVVHNGMVTDKEMVKHFDVAAVARQVSLECLIKRADDPEDLSAKGHIESSTEPIRPQEFIIRHCLASEFPCPKPTAHPVASVLELKLRDGLQFCRGDRSGDRHYVRLRK